MTSTSKNACLIAGKKIIVAGGGISGLSFTIALYKQWAVLNPSLTPPTVTIYERDSQNLSPQREGYSLSIRSDGPSKGMHTLQKLGLLDLLISRSVSGDEHSGSFCAWDGEWNEVLRIKQSLPAGLPQPHMRLARYMLRKTLIEAVPKEAIIHWETTCTGATKLENGRVSVQLSNGQVDECDLLVAADGSRSKIRTSFGFDEKLDYQGVVCLMGNAKFEGEAPPPANKDYGMHIGGKGVGLFVGTVDEHSVVWSLSYLSPEPRDLIKQPIPKTNCDEIIEEALARGIDIPEPFATYVKATDLSTLGMLNAQDRQPFPHYVDKLADTNVVFLGDANHAVSPFAGNGANLALMDGWDFADQLCKHATLAEAFKAYDALNIPRAKSVIKMSHWNIYFAHMTGWRIKFYTFLIKILAKFL